ncbi:hypothetical protein GTH52_02960 [Clostridium tyrobutyricum]|uniref:Uncharacterized protein n=1 Tax=Clostridium tyrobutyricum DIVETGP TaxID=1408889 RepID=W6N4I6_CLOTY|nr:hypothetical protein [Clostridium tyrobutyricum]AND85183.1 hypothetical protein CTK_C19310 [Clostridium tyrobutyricum]ANP69741.1 hypothetical protein BA182_08655 [Clostridium tyrobutyricum]MBV4432898.1 hypothetical protein [Clostridium tyrobutyricum]QCH27177.1 hypothetical protein EZN00_00771 [Clostridium tyrobutyricum]QNB65894.1 hypothetical protein GTH52_02960 [Clostridium tyrobutyricum]
MIQIKFSASLIEVLPIYLGTTWNELLKKTNFNYSRATLYHILQGRADITLDLNTEFNRVFTDVLKLDSTDLQNLYKLIEVTNTGKIKYKKFNGGM